MGRLLDYYHVMVWVRSGQQSPASSILLNRRERRQDTLPFPSMVGLGLIGGCTRVLLPSPRRIEYSFGLSCPCSHWFFTAFAWRKKIVIVVVVVVVVVMSAMMVIW